MITRSIVVSFILLTLSAGTSAGQDFSDLSLTQLDLQLNAILKTRLPQEKRYVAEVVKRVGENRLPLSVVYSSFKWVLKRRPNAKNRFVYFVRVLQFQGKRDKLPVPKFDFGIYSESDR